MGEHRSGGALTLALLCMAGPAAATPLKTSTEEAAIEAVARDYVDGQLEGDAARVARALHPDLAKRAVGNESPRERFALRRMSADELIELTADGTLKTPRPEWQRTVTVLDVAGSAAVARVETPWFVDFLHLGRFGTEWLIVNALWWPKPAPVTRSTEETK